jgi:hypothetical protein
MLERYEGKLSRTVLRRGGASNRPIRSLRFITAESAEKYFRKLSNALRLTSGLVPKLSLKSCPCR